MTLERHGTRVTGTYRYTRAGVSLRLEGLFKGSSARLHELYGLRSRTAAITARVREDGSLEGTWTPTDGAVPLSFRARPLAPVEQPPSIPPRQARRPANMAEIKAHRPTPASPAARRATPQHPIEERSSRRDPASEFLLAVRRGNTARALAMLDENVSADVRDQEARTALMLACRFRNDASEEASFPSIEDRQRFVNLLIERGASVNAADGHGNTPLMYATASWGAGNPILDLLLEAGADVNARNFYRGTALMVATGKYGHSSTVQLLIQAGANVNLRDKFGHTALWYARSHRAPASVHTLQTAGAAE